jgi:hypothetical protein
MQSGLVAELCRAAHTFSNSLLYHCHGNTHHCSNKSNLKHSEMQPNPVAGYKGKWYGHRLIHARTTRSHQPIWDSNQQLFSH